MRLNGITELAITKLDVLSGLETISVAVAYELDGVEVETFPAQIASLERCRPVYEHLPGWDEDIADVRRFEDLPRAAQDYLRFIEELAGVPVSIVSVGPNTDQTILCSDNILA